MTTGIVFNIQRCSLHDGPGVRTTAFLKGCSLRCMWCQKPEGLDPGPSLSYSKEKCVSCGRCKGIADGTEAARVCPSGAREVIGRRYSSEELARELIRDRAFFRKNGGVTFSGGECLMQADFVAETSALLLREGISVAIDTCGNVPFGSIEKQLDSASLFLYDIKTVNDSQHRRFTGSGNRTILRNFERLYGTGARIWVRIPVVGGFNTSDEDVEALSEYLKGFPEIERVEPLRYHKLGMHKYERLGMTYQMNDTADVSDEQFGKIRKCLESVISS